MNRTPTRSNRASTFERHGGIKNRFERTSEWFLFAIRSFLFFGIIALLFIIIKKTVDRSDYTLKPFEVPTILDINGYNGKVICHRIIDEIKLHYDSANTSKKLKSFNSDDLESDFQVDMMGFGLSLNTITDYVESAFGLKSKTISGEIVREYSKLKLFLRISDHPTRVFTVPFSDERFAEGIKELANFASFQILEITDPYIAAIRYSDRGEYIEALKLCNQVIAKDNDEKPWGYALKGLIQQRQNNITDAFATINEGLRLFPTFHLLHLRKGDLHIWNEHEAEALAAYRNFFWYTDQTIDDHLAMADGYWSAKSDSAHYFALRALSMDSTNFEALEWLARYSYYEMSDNIKAQYYATRAADFATDLRKAERIFYAFLDQQDYKNAELWAKFIVQRKEDYHSYQLMGKLYEQTGNLRFSRLFYRNSYLASNRNPTNEIQYGYNLMKLNEPDSAILHLQAAVTLDSTKSLPFYHLSAIYLKKGNLALAKKAILKYYEREVQVKPFVANRSIADFYEEIEDYDQAIFYWKDNLSRYPDDATCLNSLAYNYELKGDYENGLNYARKAVTLDGNHEMAFSTLGELYYLINKKDSAYYAFEMAMENGFTIYEEWLADEPYRQFGNDTTMLAIIQRYQPNSPYHKAKIAGVN
ncbi:MAG TPA: hypothetical protein VD927_02520 [Chryseosolibacter sp.]|nr:hypothetical protein [Chryseosolibacter sp.]